MLILMNACVSSLVPHPFMHFMICFNGIIYRFIFVCLWKMEMSADGSLSSFVIPYLLVHVEIFLSESII